MKVPDYKRRVSGRRGTWTQTAAGTRFFPLDPRPGDFEPEWLAEQLAKCARFAGGTANRFYSVAEHCVLVAEWAPSYAKREALLHDGEEGPLVDIPRPIKHHAPGMRGYRRVADRVRAAVFERFGVEPTARTTAAVERADKEVLARECLTLMVHPEWSMMPGYSPAMVIVKALEWREAKAAWLETFWRLFPEEAKR